MGSGASQQASPQASPPDVLALLRQQGEQIAALSGQVAELQKRLAQVDAQAGQVCPPAVLAARFSINMMTIEIPESSAVRARQLSTAHGRQFAFVASLRLTWCLRGRGRVQG